MNYRGADSLIVHRRDWRRSRRWTASWCSHRRKRLTQIRALLCSTQSIARNWRAHPRRTPPAPRSLRQSPRWDSRALCRDLWNREMPETPPSSASCSRTGWHLRTHRCVLKFNKWITTNFEETSIKAHTFLTSISRENRGKLVQPSRTVLAIKLNWFSDSEALLIVVVCFINQVKHPRIDGAILELFWILQRYIDKQWT